MDDAGGPGRFQRRAHCRNVSDVAVNKSQPRKVFRPHDGGQPPAVLAAIEDHDGVATFSERFDNPRSDAALRSGDEISPRHCLIGSLSPWERVRARAYAPHHYLNFSF